MRLEPDLQRFGCGIEAQQLSHFQVGNLVLAVRGSTLIYPSDVDTQIACEFLRRHQFSNRSGLRHSVMPFICMIITGRKISVSRKTRVGWAGQDCTSALNRRQSKKGIKIDYRGERWEATYSQGGMENRKEKIKNGKHRRQLRPYCVPFCVTGCGGGI